MDILSALGNIRNIEEAFNFFKEKMDEANFLKISKMKNEGILLQIANSIALCNPASVFLNTGSSEDNKYIKQLALENKEEEKLPAKYHTVHFDLKEEQGRIIDRTFYIYDDEDETVNSLAKKMKREKALDDVKEKMTNIMNNMVMIVGFYIRGPIGSPVSNPAVEITSSAYVSHSADILYRNIFADFESEVERLGHHYINLHSQGKNRPEDLPNARVFMDRKYLTTYSINCTYAGNTLLLKKGNHRFSVDKAVYKNKGKELAEHMFITGIRGKDNKLTWIAGAAPSGCGKTTTAMAGEFFIGDDLAHLWIDEEGKVRAVNPEIGIFGIIENVNEEGDRYLMKALTRENHEVIWSNVLIDDKGTPRWTGDSKEAPKKGRNFQGEWTPNMTDEKGKQIPMSHPNARVTLRANSLVNCSKKIDLPEGVIIRGITYTGRDSNTMPTLLVAKTPTQGVFMGAMLVSEATATEVGAKGVKRVPWANSAFIPGDIGDYFDAQLKFFENKDIDDEYRPVFAYLNYFLTRKERGLPGERLLGDKEDVIVWLSWLEKMINKEVEAVETIIGYIPRYEDLEELFRKLLGKKYIEDMYARHFLTCTDNIMERIDLQIEAYKKEKNISQRFFDTLERLKKELDFLVIEYGNIINPNIFIHENWKQAIIDGYNKPEKVPLWDEETIRKKKPLWI